MEGKINVTEIHWVYPKKVEGNRKSKKLSKKKNVAEVIINAANLFVHLMDVITVMYRCKPFWLLSFSETKELLII